MRKLIDTVNWTFRFYSLTLVLPIALSIMNILLVGIIGLKTKFSFLENFKVIWIDYYLTGSLGGVAAWRLQLGVLFLCFLLMLSTNKK